MMQAVSLVALQKRLNAELIGDDFICESIVTDSRKLTENALFIALQGENFDGHDFVSDMEAGKNAAVVSRDVQAEVSLLKVENTEYALGQIAAMQREMFKGPVVGLTGSCGKTSTKEMIAAILATQGNVMATQGNLNNEIGVPLSLLELEEQHDMAVIEMGAAEKGDIAYLCQFSQPDIALLTNVHAAHIGRFGSLQAIIETKGEIYSSLKSSGIAVINNDEVSVDYWRSNLNGQKEISFAINSRADVMAKNIELLPRGSSFEVHARQKVFRIELNVPGKHSIYNALAAIAVATVLNVPTESIQSALQSFSSVSGRGDFIQSASGATLINETYNSNPGAMKAAIDLLLSQTQSKKILVMADMAEMGDMSKDLHSQVGVYAKNAGVEHFYTCGPDSKFAAEAFGSKAKAFLDKNELTKSLLEEIDENCVVMIKGSRSQKMEDVVEVLAVGGVQ